MKWQESLDIEANIETIWRLFGWDQQQRIMPQVVENKLIEEKQEALAREFNKNIRKESGSKPTL